MAGDFEFDPQQIREALLREILAARRGGSWGERV